MANPNLTFGRDGVTTNPNVKDSSYKAPRYDRGTLDYSTSDCAEKESNYHAALMAESLAYAAGPVNVFPMLGFHNQGSTIDQPGAGFPLSSGTPAGFNIANAFNVNDESWQTIETGASVQGVSFIGYDFGTKKAWEAIGPAQDRYFPASPVYMKISTVKIKQSPDPTRRALQVKIEGSNDGVNWTRVDAANIPSTDQLVTFGVLSSVGYNKWRIVPTLFAGITTAQPWEVVELHFLESTQMSLDDVEDLVLLENRDRSYSRVSTLMKCTYDLLDVQSELAKFGITLPQTYIFTCSFADMVLLLGRPVVVGDIIELPGEIQYDHNLKPVRKWLEVTDTAWSTEGYTQNWRPNLYRFYAQPIMASVEHKDILGTPGQVNAEMPEDDLLLSALQNDQAQKASKLIQQLANDAAPMSGNDTANIQSGKPIIGLGLYDGHDRLSEDALPPNGEAFTSGDALPDPNMINDGHYHRQTYTNVQVSIRPQDRLLKWSATKKRWIVVEVNTRHTLESHKKTMSSILSSSTRMNPDSPI